jgi:uncharacterized protein (TIGR04141 family)
MSLKVTFDDEFTEDKPLLYFVCGDITYKNDVYFLNNQRWYRASQEFLTMMTRELDNIECIDPTTLGLTNWDKTKFPREEDYSQEQKGFLVMDQQFVVVEKKGQIEFCDLLKISGDDIYLIHVKPETGAALRALFAQGFISAQLFAESEAFRKKIYEGDIQMTAPGLTPQELETLKTLQKRFRREMKIVFAIFDDKPTHTVAVGQTLTSEVLKGALTTFPKVDLLYRATSLRAMGYEVAVCRIKPYPSGSKKKSSRRR